MPARLPNLSNDAEQLIHQTADFLFSGEPTEQIHPDIEPSTCFPDRVMMPASELTPGFRHAAVAYAISHSLTLLVREGIEGVNLSSIGRGYVSSVTNPKAYLDLYSAGKKLDRLARRGSISIKTDQELEEHLDPLLIAATFYAGFTQRFSNNQDLLKSIIDRMKYAEPKLAEGETPDMREEGRDYRYKKKLQRWRYIRPLATAAVSGLLTLQAYGAAEQAQTQNPIIIAQLETEKANATQERQEEIDKQLIQLQSQMEGDTKLWGLVTILALGRLGANYLDRPKRPTT